ncbi:MAG: methionine synthase [Streptosporangiales bacterium]|nr:methionine synthase [Streptosporangiales bacterium]MBO0890083.1 methionine synthase [Acidothermales bacterium]
MPEPNDVPWSPGTATGIGSWPGDDPLETARTVVGEVPNLPYLPELPGRGPGADMVGRTAASLLVGLEVDLQPAGWRLVDRPGVDARRARAMLGHDLDAFEEAAQASEGPVKVQVCGPWTLAARLELPRGGPVLADTGARRDVAESLAEGVSAHIADVRRRLPGAPPLVQLDEPALPAALAGTVPTASGFSRVDPVEPQVATATLADVVTAVAEAGGWPLVHCCASGVPLRLLRAAGARAVALDVSLLTSEADDDVGELVEAGFGLLLGAVPSTDHGGEPSVDEVAGPVRELWRRVGLAGDLLGARVAVTPTCGLAGASPGWARKATALCAQAARALGDLAG